MPALRPYQEVGSLFLSFRSRALLGDDMGLGKTAQAATALSAVLSQRGGRALVICPASLRINWQRELAVWCPEVKVGLPNDHWDNEWNSQVIVLSYNSLKKYHRALRSTDGSVWSVVICDEAHYMKTLDSQRTIQIRGGFGVSPIPAHYKWALTGTPMLNRPIELYPILKWLEAPFAKKEVQFGARYCGGFDQQFKGATNIAELRENLKSVMLRRLKSDVLTELPPKIRQVIELEVGEGGKALIAEEKNALREARMSFEDVVSGLSSGKKLDFTQQGVIARLRKLTGLAKVEAAAEYILECLESVDKVIVFAHHREVIYNLRLNIDHSLNHKDQIAVTLIGGMTSEDKDYAVQQFQNNPKCRVFFGNIEAAGTGLTLTAASLVIFVEQDWTPGKNIQAEDRAHRIGQTDNVFVQYLVLNGSLDASVARSVIAKQSVLDAILD